MRPGFWGRSYTSRPKLVGLSGSSLLSRRYLDAGFDRCIEVPLRPGRVYAELAELLGIEYEYDAVEIRVAADLRDKLSKAAATHSITELKRYIGELESLGPEEQRLAAHLSTLGRGFDMARPSVPCCVRSTLNEAPSQRTEPTMRMIDLDLRDSKILVVDDVPANLDVLVGALDREGYNVLVASNGTTALEVAAHARPDLILLDVMMPGIDGFETCRRLQSDHNLEDTPVIFLTARDDIEGIVEGFQAGGLDYITKPFKKEEVLVRVRTHLERTLLARNLAELNAHLEQKVAERTREVQLRLKELEGKDRIAQHLLTFNTLEETLAVVLEVITNILKLDRARRFSAREGRAARHRRHRRDRSGVLSLAVPN